MFYIGQLAKVEAWVINPVWAQFVHDEKRCFESHLRSDAFEVEVSITFQLVHVFGWQNENGAVLGVEFVRRVFELRRTLVQVLYRLGDEFGPTFRRRQFGRRLLVQPRQLRILVFGTEREKGQKHGGDDVRGIPCGCPGGETLEDPAAMGNVGRDRFGIHECDVKRKMRVDF